MIRQFCVASVYRSVLLLLVLSLSIVSLTASFSAAAQSAAPTPLPTEEAAAIRTVIEAQISAFRADDAARAFSFATPEIRAMFGTPETFVRMVRQNYPVIFRPATVHFQVPVDDAGETIQIVELTDQNGNLWLALYRMQKQGGTKGSERDRGQWRIGGVVLSGTRDRAT